MVIIIIIIIIINFILIHVLTKQLSGQLPSRHKNDEIMAVKKVSTKIIRRPKHFSQLKIRRTSLHCLSYEAIPRLSYLIDNWPRW
jgi:hypothetical protein